MSSHKHTKSKLRPRGAVRNQPAPKETPAAIKQPLPSWMWMGIGMLISALAALGIYRWESKKAEPPTAASAKAAAEVAAPANLPPPKYEFYNMLQEQQTSTPPGLVNKTPTPAAVVTPPPVAPVAPATPPVAPLLPPVTPPARTASLNVPPAQPLPPTPAPTAKAAPAAPPPPPAPTATPPASSRYVVQTGSFSTREQAESARAQLLLSGQDARVESGLANGRSFFRVVVGPFNNRQQADSAQRQLGQGIVQERH